MMNLFGKAKGKIKVGMVIIRKDGTREYPGTFKYFVVNLLKEIKKLWLRLFYPAS